MAGSLSSCPNCMHVFNLPGADLPPLAPTVVSVDILETNNPPLASQIPMLRDFISHRRVHMAALDAKIAVLQTAPATLFEQKVELDLEIGIHEGALSPLRRIPAEILSHIFAFTLPPHLDTESARWTVSAVCARWWTIIISQPCFWASICYRWQRAEQGYKYETQLRRSGQLPLHVEFSANEWRDLSVEEEHIVQLICKHAARWETALFSGPEQLFDQLQLSIQGDRLAQLRRLSIEVDYNGNEALPLDMFHDAPLLRTVHVNRDLWPFPVAMVLPWAQLSGYSGSNTWSGHLHALHSASNLVDCSLEIQETSTPTQTPIVLPRLLRLSLSNPHFLGCLETPALLELYCDHDTGPVLSFLCQQACQLQKLVLRRCLVPPDSANLTRIVEAVPTVKSLSLLFSLPLEFAHDFSSRLTMAPALEYLSGTLARGSEEVEAHFLQAIETRWLHHQLKSAKVYNTDSSTIHNRVKALRAQGMDCVVLDQSRSLLDDIPLELRISSVNSFYLTLV
ncbi:hypothetical protein DFH08DRAFT_896834 [Mycena albidolilacea]|uniref:F-box domain-containing protein n=1 Tax=Mycena albidolilacea TaxID=1033008 RepID=A0AAD7ECT1_9AGAR|nr:hypothetical protein DFH08DRAFT_896834 [Mycena albidolilacea]